MAVGSIIAGIGFSIPVARSRRGVGRLSDEIKAAAEDSVGTPFEVDPNQGTQQICDQALREPSGQSDRVHNAEVGELCLRGHRLATRASISWAFAGIGLVSTAVFTGLLFAKPRGARARAHRQHRRVYFATGPSSHRGWSVATRVRF